MVLRRYELLRYEPQDGGLVQVTATLPEQVQVLGVGNLRALLNPEHIAEGAGRWVGWWNVEETGANVPVTHDEFVLLRRMLRRLARRRGYRARARSRYQGVTVFSRGARWQLFRDVMRYLESLRAPT